MCINNNKQINSSNINEVIRAVLNFFFTKRFHNHKKAQNAYKRTKVKIAPKKHLRRKIVTYLLICVFVLLPEGLCGVQCFQCFQCFQCVQNLFIKENKEFKVVLITSFILLLIRHIFCNKKSKWQNFSPKTTVPKCIQKGYLKNELSKLFQMLHAEYCQCKDCFEQRILKK